MNKSFAYFQQAMADQQGNQGERKDKANPETNHAHGLTYPPKPVRGSLVTGPMTPPGATDTTYPAELAAGLEAHFGAFIFDVDNFRTEAAHRA